jgi:drug/metabolite transporter (DMT)-like permease
VLGPLVCVAAAALCSGTAIVLQAVAARRLPSDVGLGTVMVRRLAVDPVYLVAMVLVASGFGLAAVALRSLPLFVVQAGRASSLGVAAVLSVLVLGARLRPLEWAGLAVTAAGLVALALSVDVAPAVPDGATTPAVMVAAVVLVAAGIVAGLGRATTGRGLLLACLAGASFSVLALAARTLPGLGLPDVLTEPAAWCAGVAGLTGLGLSALALRRAPVVVVTALMVGVETVASAVVGLVLAGDRALPGREWLALVAFTLVVAGVVVVARAGTPDAHRHDAATGAAPGETAPAHPH